MVINVCLSNAFNLSPPHFRCSAVISFILSSSLSALYAIGGTLCAIDTVWFPSNWTTDTMTTHYSCMPWLLIPWIDNQLKPIMYYLSRTSNPSLFCMFQCSMCGFLFLGCLPRIYGKLSAWLWSGSNLYLVIYTTYCVVCVPMSKVPQPYRCHCISVCPFCSGKFETTAVIWVRELT